MSFKIKKSVIVLLLQTLLFIFSIFSNSHPLLAQSIPVCLNKLFGAFGQLGITSSSVVAITGPVSLGSVIREDRSEEVSSPVTLNVPSGPGQYFVLFIDDNPDFRYEHPVRYAWYNCVNGTYQVINANWPMTIYPPNRSPTPYTPSWSTIFNGVEVTFGSGEFAGQVVTNLTTRGQVPEIAVGSSTLTIIDLLSSSFSARAQEAPVEVPKCLKEAFVFDMGDKNGWRSLASKGSKDADLMESYLKRMGFNVSRRSNYWGNNHKRVWRDIYIDLNSYLFDVDDRIREENRKGAVRQCVHHEVFLYLIGHGGEGSASYYNPNGNGEVLRVEYLPLTQLFEKFQNNVTFYIFVDSCKSGSLITIGRPQRLIDNGKFAVYIITSTSATGSTHAGNPFNDSSTEDFIDGMQKTDWDNDGKKPDDIGDGFAEMVDDGVFFNMPQRFRRPDVNDSWYYSLELFKPEQVEYELPVP